ncbi:MAG: dephospho-CoA kinase [Nanoarchaeota archaeon]|nr:dephospho-CoA kinase [Nanoarchaeota archaeon]
MIIGVTGSFGSGKTTVANMFGKYGFKVINVDKLYHGIYNKNKALKNKIKKEFGTLDRNQLKKIVFNNSAKLKKLNKLTHPIIIKTLKKEIKNNKKIVVDIPLLFESKLEKMFDKIIVVKCDKKTQIKRILKKNKYSRKEINNIINSQMPLKEKIKKVDFVLDNDGINETKSQVNSIINSIQNP